MIPRLLRPSLLPLTAVAALAAAAGAAPALALVNESPSLPEGLYLRTTGAPGPGAVVAVEPPAEARAYLAGLGMPASVKLLKRVAATGGARVCAQGREVHLPDRGMERRLRDRRGASLPLWSGCRRLEPDELFVLGDTPDSFDSRYFGPVRRTAVAGVYRGVLTW